MKDEREKITDQISIPEFLAKDIEKKLRNLFHFQEEIKKHLEKDISSFLNALMAGSICLQASDLHIEPLENRSNLRIRLDGVLNDLVSLEKKHYQTLLSRIKLLSGLKLNVENRPQDGNFSILLPTEKQEKPIEIEIRVSTLPSEHGETIVLRFLDSRKLIELEELGLREDLYQLFSQEIKKPNGMIIVTGPTGSGKTTSLYTFLKAIKSPGVKIITIEDPIEYHLDGVSQTEVSPKDGYDFANGLRAIVRQDPDVILIGEIRDLETASIGLQAALTGHTVFSTLHTNDAAGAIPRLQALGEKPVNIAPAINIIIAQRLLRKLCPRCKEKKVLSETDSDLYQKVKDILSNVSEKLKIELNEETFIYQKKGCRDCNFSGYLGRLGVFEVLVITEEIENLIFKNPSTSDIKNIAVKSGMVTIQQDALIKMLNGETDFNEVNRVVGL